MDKVFPNLRNSILHVPDRFVGTSHLCPLILAFHGGGGNAAKFQAGSLFERQTDPAGFAVAWLNGTPGDGSAGSADPCHPAASPDALVWNAGDPTAIPPRCAFGAASDPKWILVAVGMMSEEDNIDGARFFCTGISNGSEMCYKMIQSPLRFRAAAPVSGDWQYQGRWSQTPVMHVHGCLDQREPWNGSSVWPYFLKHDGPVPSFIKDVAACNGWNGIEQPISGSGGEAPDDWVETIYPGGAETRLLQITNGGHNWPGGATIPPMILKAEKLGPQTKVPVGQMIVDFFLKHL